MELDDIERKILEVLQDDGRVSNAELARRVGLSESPCLRRVKRLESVGVIDRYSARINRRMVGLAVTAYVEVKMDRQPDEKTEHFLACVRAEPYIIECHAMSGSYDYLMKVVARSIDHFSDLCMQKILKFPGVSNIESRFSLVQVKVDAPIPT